MRRDVFQCHCLSFLLILLFAAVPAWSSNTIRKDKENNIKIPLMLLSESDSHPEGWKAIPFQNSPANKVVFNNDGLHIEVQCSSSLLVYCLGRKTDIHRIRLIGKVTGLPRIPEGREQGDEKADDFAIRLGLVLSGEKTLGSVKKLFASDFVKYLSQMIPKRQGIDHILFLNLANDPPPM